MLWNSRSDHHHGGDQPTRQRVARSILVNGPSTAAALAERLDLTPAAVRRHLDQLVEEGAVEAREPRSAAVRGRGRPAKLFALTEHGRDGFDQQYDDLAVDALRFLAETGGDDAVRAFAERRVAFVEERFDEVSQQQPKLSPAEVLAQVFTDEGYAAAVRELPMGEQLCQQHCPVSHVAHEFPQLCEAETEAIGRVLGRHVQRLATIAHGDGVCTTCIPDPPKTQKTKKYTEVPDHDHHDEGEGHSMTSIEELNPELKGIAIATSSAGPTATTPVPPRRAGLNEGVVRDISEKKNEPQWMLDLRLKGLKLFHRKPMPTWGSDLSAIDFDNIKYFVRSSEKQATSWEDLPEDIKNTYDKLGIPEAEKQRLVAGVAAQYESEVVYHSIREDLEAQGVLFLDTDTALREQPELFQEYFGTVIPVGDNKFAALNTSVWSGGSFIYVPKGVHVDIPLQAYFRINTENMGQFERTLIIVDEDAYVHYVEGCTAPIYSSDSLHSAVVEIIVKKGGRCRYTTIQNWSNNVYNLVTKRATCEAGATMEWVDGNIGSKVTMKYPAIYLMGEHAKGETLSIAFAGEGQHQDAGAKMVHAAPHTSSSILSKSVARGGGRTSYRGLIQINEGAHGSKSNVLCDALLVDQISRSDTYPYVDIREDDVSMGHEASVSKVSDDQLFYLMSRGMGQDEAMAMIVRGFVEPIAKELPMEYALELNRLIELQMEGAVRLGSARSPHTCRGRVALPSPTHVERTRCDCDRHCPRERLSGARARQDCLPPQPAAVVRPGRPPGAERPRGDLAVHAAQAAPRDPRRRGLRRAPRLGHHAPRGRDPHGDQRDRGGRAGRARPGRPAGGPGGGQRRGSDAPRRARRPHRRRAGRGCGCTGPRSTTSCGATW